MKVTDEDRKYESKQDNDTDEKDRRDEEDDITSMIKTKAKRLLYTPKHSSKKQESNKQIY